MLERYAYRIIEDSLNLRDTKIFDYVIDDDGKRKPVLNKKETAIAQGKQDIIKQEFKDWIWKEPERRQRLTEYYNEHFNAIRPREFDGSHLRFYGINPEITLRKHQLDGAARIIYGGNTLLAYQSDIETARENTPESREEFPPMEVKGTVYHDKKEAGQAVIEACKSLNGMDGEMIGKYRGFYMELSYSSYASGFTITLQGKMEHKVAFGTDIFGNVTRLDNEIEKFPDKMERCRAKLENLKLQMENGKKELEKEFPHEKELAEKTARLAELNVLLDMDKKDHVVMDEEPEEEREEGGREKERGR